MPRITLRNYAAILFALALMVAAVGGCSKESPKSTESPNSRQAASGPPRNILFVTFDTTRADHIGCYGRPGAKTPAVDALAARGTRFDRAYAQAPLTLPSHSTMMTGRYPRELGVRDNGREAVSAAHETLAEHAHAAGFRTAAFISAFVLDSRFGLDQGFDLYDDDLKIPSAEVDLLDLERRGDLTADRALAWLKADADKPFFCWVHFFDPHHPYEPPEPFASQLEDPYDGELAFTDAQFGRLIEGLAATGLLDQTLVVVLGDHGESFGEHGDNGHSTFLYNTNLHVPFIVAGPGVGTGVVGSPVEIFDIYPTVCELMGWKAPADLLSISLVPALKGRAIEPGLCYSESQFAYNAYRYAEQRSITANRWKYISSTRPELFDLLADPDEKNNVIADHSDVESNLSTYLARRYGEMIPGKAQPVVTDAKAEQAMQSLGYVGGAPDADTALLTPGLPDPKDMLAILQALKSARSMIAAGRNAEALELLQAPLQESPDSIEVLSAVAACYINLGKPDQAIAPLTRALKIEPTYPAALEEMGDALSNLGRYVEAEKHYAAAAGQRLHDARSIFKHGLSLKLTDRPIKAAGEFRRALELHPGYEAALGELLSLPPSPSGYGFDILDFLKDLARTHPADAGAQLSLGVALMAVGDIHGAVVQFETALRLDPKLGTALNKLGICAARVGATEKAVQCFQRAVAFESSRPEGLYNLGVTAEKGGALKDAVSFYEQAIAFKPSYDAAIVALVRILQGAGRAAEAIQVLKAGATACPADARIITSLASLLATTPDDALRDGPAAVAFAERASRLTGGQHPEVLGILASAYAECGRFDEAIKTGGLAIDRAKALGAAELATALEAQVNLYRSGKPYREAGQ